MKTILLVEDDDHLRQLERATLETPALRVLEARDGEEALKLLRNEPIDVLVLDWMLPGMAGVHVMRTLERSHRAPPTIMVSAKTRERDVMRARMAGIQHYLTKPFSPLELLQRVEQMLAQ